MGVSRATFGRLVGDAADPDFTASDGLLPHPTDAAQQWVSIVNPTAATVETVVTPLLDEARARLVGQKARRSPEG